jgi:outer membrane protein assembly factor BamB
VIYCAAGKKIYKLTEGVGTATWTYPSPADLPDACNSGPVAYNGKVYFGTKDSSYYVITDNGATATIVTKWPYPMSTGKANAGPWIDAVVGKVYFGTTGGRVDAFPLQ